MATASELVPRGCVTAIVPVGNVGVPVNVGEANGAFKSKAAWVNVLIVLLASLVLSTYPKPTIAFVIPLTVPVNVGLLIGAFKTRAGTLGKSAVPPKSPANFNFPLIILSASGAPEDTVAST